MKALVEACDAEQVALFEPLLTMLFETTQPLPVAPRDVQEWDDPADRSEMGCSDDVGYRTYTFGRAVAEGTVVGLRYAPTLCCMCTT